jgi:hypothetical protein
LKQGQEVEGVVTQISASERRISLSLKRLQADPWENLGERYPLGQVVEGRVRNLTSYGAFVAKVLAGGTDKSLLDLLKTHFRTVKHAKPPASRKGSSEWYVVAQGFKGRA